MGKQATIGGRSLVFNLMFVLLNIAGIVFVLLGSHPSQEHHFILFNFIGYILFLLSIGGLILFQGKLLMANIARWLVGSIFIFSGIIKLNDPVGFALKLEEYFQDGALAFRIKVWFNSPSFSLEFLQDSAFLLGILIIIIELILGVFLIIGGKIRSVAFYLIGLMLFFTFLTWHSATCDPKAKFWDENTYLLNEGRIQDLLKNPLKYEGVRIMEKTNTAVVLQEQKSTQCVSDCGCFGDALKGAVGRSLTPLESLFKDLVLLYLALWILLSRKQIQPNTRNQNVQFLIAFSLIATYLAILFNWYFPLAFSFFLLIGALWVRRSGGVLLGNYLGSAFFIVLVIIATVFYVLRYDPIKDFRPFAVGNDLKQKMTDGQIGVYEIQYQMKNLKTGEVANYSQKEYLNNPALWDTLTFEIIAQTQKELVPEIPPSIGLQFNPLLDLKTLSKKDLQSNSLRVLLSHCSDIKVQLQNEKNNSDTVVNWKQYISGGFENSNYRFLSLQSQNNWNQNVISFREVMLKMNTVVLLVSDHLDSEKWEGFEDFQVLINYFESRKIPLFLITRASGEELNAYKKNLGPNVIALQNYDEVGLKMVSRANPAILLIEKGKVKGKYTQYDLPNVEDLKSILSNQK
jgi:uncharacterized membrane protein YphA (DoxX/SURF4 family)